LNEERIMADLKVPVSAGDHILGDQNAAVTLVEYGDYECPHCAAAHPVVKAVQRHFAQQLAFVFRHFPLTEIHPNAGIAAESAEYAAVHGRFWEMHDLIFENQTRLSSAFLLVLAGSLGLSQSELRDALSRGIFTPKVQGDYLGGVHSGVNGTPTFFVDGIRHKATYDFPHLVSAIESRLHAKALP
jgi:protein-disulfide isomerase